MHTKREDGDAETVIRREDNSDVARQVGHPVFALRVLIAHPLRLGAWQTGTWGLGHDAYAASRGSGS
jgi:hypothetical protein